MKAIVNLGNLVIDVKNLPHLEKLLLGADKQDYDYKDNKCIYHIKPLDPAGISVTLLPDDLYEAQCLIYKLKQEQA